MRLVLFGAPGSGKGTQARLIVEKYGIPKIVPSQLLRDALQEATPLGMQARNAIETTGSVPDEILIAIIRERITQPDASKGFILDGFPETVAQAQAFDQLLEVMGKSLSVAILLETDFDALMQRITGRRSCLSCGHVCNIYTDPPKLDGQCDECGGNLRHRADDNEEIISNRFRVYEAQTHAIIDYYRDNGCLRVVQGIGEVDDIFNAISAILDEIDLDEDQSPMPTLEVLEQMIMEKAQKAQAEVSDSGTEESDTTKKKVRKKKVSSSRKSAATTVKPETETTKKTPASKKTTVKKSAPKKAVSKKKAAPKKASPKKATARKKPVTRKKTTAKKSAAKKTVVKKKTAAKKTSPKKKVVKKKTTVKKASSKKKVAAKKKAVKKKAATTKKLSGRKKSASSVKPKKALTKKKQSQSKTALKKKKPATKKTAKKTTRRKK